jgi:uncharacterized protein (TIGR03032 family)
MGVAIDEHRMFVGTSNEICEFHNSTTIAHRLEPLGKHDRCYVPRHAWHTGDIHIHDMAIAGSQLWFVNTRFSCLCTIHPDFSFLPLWQPDFITDLAAEDRCHMNGMAIQNAAPTHVSVLGLTNACRGWRENKRNGGAILSVPESQVIVEGLSMPHSPRWHQGKLWALQSGLGALGLVDLARGRFETVAELPGFTRGLAFHGNLAFVGLSQVRETATFGGLPITEQSERLSGVWVVDIATGQIVAFLRFDGSVREVFEVMVLPETQYPELLMREDPRANDTFILPEA